MHRPTQEATRSGSNRRWWVIAATLSASVLAGLIWWAGPVQVMSWARRAAIGPLVLAGLCFTLTCCFRWIRVLVLVPKKSRRSFALLGASAGHAFLTTILPWRMGELTFPVLLRRANGTPVPIGLLYLAVIRMVELACLIPLYMTAVVFWRLDTSGAEHQLWLWLAVAIACSGLFVWFLPQLVGTFLRLIDRLVQRNVFSRIPFAQKLRGSLGGCESEIQRLGTRKLVGVGVASVGVWITLFAVYYFCWRVFAEDVSIFKTIVGAGGGILANLTPGGLGSFGAFEAGWSAGFRAVGEAFDVSLATGLTLHLVVVVVSGIVAAIGMVFLMRADTSRHERGDDVE